MLAVDAPSTLVYRVVGSCSSLELDQIYTLSLLHPGYGHSPRPGDLGIAVPMT